MTKIKGSFSKPILVKIIKLFIALNKYINGKFFNLLGYEKSNDYADYSPNH